MKIISSYFLNASVLIFLIFSIGSCKNTPENDTLSQNQSKIKDDFNLLSDKKRNIMTVYKKDNSQVLQTANEHRNNIQNVLNEKNAQIALNINFEMSESAQSLNYSPDTKRAGILSSMYLENTIRPDLEKLGFDRIESDMIFAVFFQNLSSVQSIYESLLSATGSEYNPNYYKHTYEKSLCAFHYWMDNSSQEEQLHFKSLTGKILDNLKNPIPDGEFLSFYIAEHPDLIGSDIFNWLYLQAYIFDDLTGYVEHTSFGDYIAFLLEDLH